MTASHGLRPPVSFDRWLVVVLNQTESRASTDPFQPLDESKDTRRFIVISPKDQRPVFNCIECVSKKTGVSYPDVEITADGRLFTKDTIARVGYIYRLVGKCSSHSEAWLVVKANRRESKRPVRMSGPFIRSRTDSRYIA